MSAGLQVDRSAGQRPFWEGGSSRGHLLVCPRPSPPPSNTACVCAVQVLLSE